MEEKQGPNDPKEVFEALDKKKTGYIKSDQLGLALRACGLRLTHEQIKGLKAKCDAENGGQLDVDGFLDFVYEGKKIQKNEDDIEYASRIFDNGEHIGLLDTDALRNALMTMGDKMTGDEVEEVFKEIRRICGDDDARGTLDSRKIVKLMNSIQ
eukprot:TRINITY_DN5423_c0_g1_i1.p1 TRINITY_DN5423_c0_g1~~TRINITY_DN5423_c0_g1_i1.p1  ORF type:complete len:154 (-),score=46.85 TRINITY_DN5423_c0_g1_i1:42-503(-)